MVIARSWVTSALASSSNCEASPYSASAEDRKVVGKAPTCSSLLGAGKPPQASPTIARAVDGPGCAFEFACGRGAVHHELFWEAMGALSRLGEELVDIDARLEIEGLWLADEWHWLKVAINGRLHHERASAKVEASLATSREASARALEEAGEADRRREVAEERQREL